MFNRVCQITIKLAVIRAILITAVMLTFAHRVTTLEQNVQELKAQQVNCKSR